MSNRYPDWSDEALAKATAEGDPAAFETLVRRYEKRIFGFLRQRVARPVDAEDLAQQSFILAYQRIHQYKDQYKFRTWLFTIARNLAASHYRHLARRNLDDYRKEPTPAATPPQTLARREAGRQLWDLAKAELSEDHFCVLWLHYAEDMRTEDIAFVVDRSRTNVKVMLHRARKKLAARLDQTTQLTEELKPLRTTGD